MILRPTSNALAFLPRHWACAIDVVELVATLDGDGGGRLTDPAGIHPWHDTLKTVVGAFLKERIPEALMQLKGDYQ